MLESDGVDDANSEGLGAAGTGSEVGTDGGIDTVSDKGIRSENELALFTAEYEAAEKNGGALQELGDRVIAAEVALTQHVKASGFITLADHGGLALPGHGEGAEAEQRKTEAAKDMRKQRVAALLRAPALPVGLERPTDWQTCYLNSAVQVMHRVFDLKPPETRGVCSAMSDLFGALDVFNREAASTEGLIKALDIKTERPVRQGRSGSNASTVFVHSVFVQRDVQEFWGELIHKHMEQELKGSEQVPRRCHLHGIPCSDEYRCFTGRPLRFKAERDNSHDDKVQHLPERITGRGLVL